MRIGFEPTKTQKSYQVCLSNTPNQQETGVASLSICGLKLYGEKNRAWDWGWGGGGGGRRGERLREMSEMM